MATTWGLNIRFFHGRATQRKRKNAIRGLKNERREWKSNDAKIAPNFGWLLLSAFHYYIQSASLRAGNGRGSIMCNSVNECHAFTTIYSGGGQGCIEKMAPFKSPGLDGMSQSFVKIIACGWEWCYWGGVILPKFGKNLEIYKSCFHNFDSKIHPPLSLTSHLAALIINSLE